MAVNLPNLGELLPVKGVQMAAANAGIKQTDREDVSVFIFTPGTTVGGVFTQSTFRAPPVRIAQDCIRTGNVRGMVINSGNANAATGELGFADARAICQTVAERAELSAGSIMPFSTGVIGERLPVAAIQQAATGSLSALSEDNWLAAATAIMTTDTAPKAISKRVVLGSETITITGIAKGAGMMKPNMATLLTFICCDAAIESNLLQQLTVDIANQSFNRISVDGDTSTNDSMIIAASGLASSECVDSVDHQNYAVLAAALTEVARALAQYIVRDGEGATKFVTVQVNGAKNSAEALEVGYTIAESPLVKTAIFAGDPNWGRFCMAIGRAQVPDLDPNQVDLYLDKVCIAKAGLVAIDYCEEEAGVVMAQDEFSVRVELGRGQVSETLWTTDLSYEYVRINAEYRT